MVIVGRQFLVINIDVSACNYNPLPGYRRGGGALYISLHPHPEKGYAHTFSSNTEKEHPSQPGTGLKFLSLRRGLTCIIPLRQPLCVQIHIAPNITPISIVRIISTTIGAHLGAELISNRRDGFFLVFIVNSRPRAHLWRDVFLWIVGLCGR